MAIKTWTDNRGEPVKYDDSVYNDRVKYAAMIREKVQSGEITPQEGTKMLNEFGKKNKHWRLSDMDAPKDYPDIDCTESPAAISTEIVVFIDSKGFYEIPNIDMYNNEYIRDREGINAVIEANKLSPGVYLMDVLATDEDSGQYDEYGRCECSPYACVTRAKFERIGPILRSYISPAQSEDRRRSGYSKRLNALDAMAKKKSTPGRVLSVTSTFGDVICLYERGSERSWLHKQLATMSLPITEEGLARFESDVKTILSRTSLTACHTCGKEMYVKKDRLRYRNYCSLECREKGRLPNGWHKCQKCGKRFAYQEQSEYLCHECSLKKRPYKKPQRGIR